MNTRLLLSRRGQRLGGFTLVELMIAVAIVAILAAVAIPMYTQYVQKARRTDAKNALLDFAAKEERLFSIKNQYSVTASDFGYAAFPANIVSSGTAYYQLSVTFQPSNTTATFTATATRISPGAQSADPCGDYSITNLGVQSNANNTSATSSCW